MPIKIEPLRDARSAKHYEGQVFIKEMPRLAELLADDSGVAKVTLDLNIDSEGFVVMVLKAQAKLNLACQRCMKPYSFIAEVNTTLSPVANDGEIENLPEDYEAWIMAEDGSVHPKEMVEEELILSLPIVPVHDEQDCENTKVLDDLKAKSEKEDTKSHPFAELKKLKLK